MLENWRYGRAVEANKKYPNFNSLNIFLEQELLTQSALKNLGIKSGASPSEGYKVGRMFMAPEYIENLRTPYAVEVLGMPGAGKSTMITRYMEELWLRKERDLAVVANEGVRAMKDKYGDLRYTNPHYYSFVAGEMAYLNVLSSIKESSLRPRIVVSDRGQIDRRAFRRVLFTKGEIPPAIMENETGVIDSLETGPIQVGAVILFIVRPEVSMGRIGKEGPVVNMDFLPKLYEQYWRIHWEALNNKFQYRLYTCIDAEENEEKVYERFKYAMDSALNIIPNTLRAFAEVFPEEYDKAVADLKKNPERARHWTERLIGKKIGKRVLIIGGDDMKDKAEVLNKPHLEGMLKLRDKKL